MSRVLSEIGERELVGKVVGSLPQAPDVLLGPGDDAALLSTPDSRVVASTDVLVEGRHFRRDWSSATDVGHKAAAQNMADVAAMGARPTALLVGLAAPDDLPEKWALDLVAGLVAEAEPLGCSIVGGDTVSSGPSGSPIVVSVTAMGSLDGAAPVTRAGARPGDVVAVAGRLGWAEAGVAILSRGFRSPRLVADAHRRPVVDYAAGPAAAAVGATAMLDVSDGLLTDLGRVAAASGVAIDLDSAALTPDDPLVAVAGAMGVDARDWVLAGGEDHALAACFPVDVALPAAFGQVGVVLAGEGVLIDGNLPAKELSGYDHFRPR